MIDHMPELIVKADFAMGSGGVAMWERCFLGLPSAVTVAADNQVGSVDAAARYGAIWNIGWHMNTSAEVYKAILTNAMNSPSSLRCMSRRALKLTKSHANRKSSGVAEVMLDAEK